MDIACGIRHLLLLCGEQEFSIGIGYNGVLAKGIGRAAAVVESGYKIVDGLKGEFLYIAGGVLNSVCTG